MNEFDENENKLTKEEIEKLIEKHSVYFFNNLKRKKELIGKKARKLGVSCYRLYDKDIPELPFIIDVYEKYLHVSIVPKKENEDDDEWILGMIKIIAQATGVDFDNIFFKKRKIQKRGDQYQKLENKSSFITTVFENELKFEINLTDYIDTGLFFDHRNSRQFISESCLGKDVLNLFCYTGSFSVYALSGGANSVVSVDLNQNYLNWAKRNVRLNGVMFDNSEFVKDDCIGYVQNTRKLFDIIILDPPTFSTSKKMKGTLDVKRDHPYIINDCLDILKKGGFILFSNNLKDFRLEKSRINSRFIKDVTEKNLPFDFEKKRPHRAYIIEKDI